MTGCRGAQSTHADVRPTGPRIGATGKAQFALVRSGRIAAQGGINITKPGTLGFKLKLPKKLKAGSLQPAHHVHADGREQGLGQDDQDHVHAQAKKKAKRSTALGAGMPDRPRLQPRRPAVPGRSAASDDAPVIFPLACADTLSGRVPGGPLHPQEDLMAKQPRIIVGQVAAITGGGRGIGRATAKALAREGVKIAIGDLDAEAAKKVAEEIGSGAIGLAARRHRPRLVRRLHRADRGAARPDRHHDQQRRDHAARAASWTRTSPRRSG